MTRRKGLFNLMHKNEINLGRKLLFNTYKHKNKQSQQILSNDERNKNKHGREEEGIEEEPLAGLATPIFFSFA